MEISFQSNIDEWTREFRDVAARSVPFVTVMALTATAQQVAEEHRQQLPVIFDRPTRYTMNSLRVTPATRSTMRASVWFRDSPRMSRHYLLPQVEGGGRPQKRFEHWLTTKGIMKPGEFAVPGRSVRLDASGNIPAGTITQILSQLMASPDAHQWETERSRKRAGAKRVRYFVAKEGSRLPRGVWRENPRGGVSPVLIFVSSVQYEVRYRFEEIGRRRAEEVMAINFAFALERAIATDRGF